MADTVRIKPEAHVSLTKIARAKHIPLVEALSHVIESYEREAMIRAMDAAYAALQEDPKAWAEELAERELWENAQAVDCLAAEEAEGK
jgi:hypothetical protein